MRVVAGVAVASSLILADPGTASAKGAHDVIVKGPGIETPVRITCCQAPATDDGLPVRVGNPNDLASATGVLNAAFSTGPSPMVDERPRGRLGPRYRLTFNFSTGTGTVTPVRQRVYPFAEAGLVAYTPPGQRLFGSEVHSGWYVAAPRHDGADVTTPDVPALLASLATPAPDRSASP